VRIFQAKVFKQEHRQSIRLLAAGAAGTPDAQVGRMLGPQAGDRLGQHFRNEDVEM
jgi:hypothetical protein